MVVFNHIFLRYEDSNTEEKEHYVSRIDLKTLRIDEFIMIISTRAMLAQSLWE